MNFKQIETKFKNQYPHGSISKVSTNKYYVCFDARDSRSEAEKELDVWGSE